MLVLQLREGQSLMIGDNIKVTLVEIREADKARIGFEAPKDVQIVRDDAINKSPKVNPVTTTEEE